MYTHEQFRVRSRIVHIYSGRTLGRFDSRISSDKIWTPHHDALHYHLPHGWPCGRDARPERVHLCSRPLFVRHWRRRGGGWCVSQCCFGRISSYGLIIDVLSRAHLHLRDGSTRTKGILRRLYANLHQRRHPRHAGTGLLPESRATMADHHGSGRGIRPRSAARSHVLC